MREDLGGGRVEQEKKKIDKPGYQEDWRMMWIGFGGWGGDDAGERLWSSLGHWQWWPLHRWSWCVIVRQDRGDHLVSWDMRWSQISNFSGDTDTVIFCFWDLSIFSPLIWKHLRKLWLWCSIWFTVREKDKDNQFVSDFIFQGDSLLQKSSWSVVPHSGVQCPWLLWWRHFLSRPGKRRFILWVKSLVEGRITVSEKSQLNKDDIHSQSSSIQPCCTPPSFKSPAFVAVDALIVFFVFHKSMFSTRCL